jgi:hypothetical protein
MVHYSITIDIENGGHFLSDSRDYWGLVTDLLRLPSVIMAADATSPNTSCYILKYIAKDFDLDNGPQ